MNRENILKELEIQKKKLDDIESRKRKAEIVKKHDTVTEKYKFSKKKGKSNAMNCKLKRELMRKLRETDEGKESNRDSAKKKNV